MSTNPQHPRDDRHTVGSLAALGRALRPAKSRSQMSRYARRPWFPRPDADGRYDVATVQAAMDTHAHQQQRADRPAPDDTTTPAELPADDPYLAILRDPASTDLQIVTAEVRLASRVLADKYRRGLVSAQDRQAWAKVSNELRQTKEKDLALREQRRELIPADQACTLVADIIRDVTSIEDSMGDALPRQVVAWLSDPDFTAAPAEQQQHRVRQWFRRQLTGARKHDATTITARLHALLDDEQEAEA
jgi:hypothetical protein